MKLNLPVHKKSSPAIDLLSTVRATPKGELATAFVQGMSPLDMDRLNPKQATDQLFDLIGPGDEPLFKGSSLAANRWLAAASSVYKLSPRIQDYVLVPVPILFTDIPNTNGDSASLKELLAFNPDVGMQAYETFRGKPTFIEHENKVIEKAKGVILDVYLRPLKRFGNGRYYKLVQLLAWDKTKDPLLVNNILTGKTNSYSLGFYFRAYTCSICGQLFGEGGSPVPCGHTMVRKPPYLMNDGRLAYRICRKIVGFECSAVDNPAYVTAISPHVMNVSQMQARG